MLQRCERAGLEQHAAVIDVVGKPRDLRRLERRQRILRLVIHQIDHGQTRRHLRARHAVETFGHLIIQKLFGRVEQIDGYEPIGHAPDHLIAFGADGRQLDEIVEKAERLDRRDGVGFALQEQVHEGRAHVVLRRAGEFLVGEILAGDAQHIEALAPAFLFEIERAKPTQRAQLEFVAAPAEAQAFECRDGLIARDGAVGHTGLRAVEDGFGRNAFVAAMFKACEQFLRVVVAPFGGIELGAFELRLERQLAGKIMRQMVGAAESGPHFDGVGGTSFFVMACVCASRARACHSGA